MKDPEFIEMRNRFLVAVTVALLFAIPLFIFIFNKFGDNKSELLKLIENEEDVIILVEDNKCDFCLEVRKILEENNIEYFSINKDTDQDFSTIMQEVKLSENVVEPPGIIYLEKGKKSINATGLETEDEVMDFIKLYKNGSIELDS